MRLSRFLLPGIVVLATGPFVGCATLKVQAPYDSFVCYNSTFTQCVERAQTGKLRALQHDTVVHLAQSNFIYQDPDAGKTVSTGDNKYQCAYGTVPYTQALDPTKQSPAVFVSPVLLREIAEQGLRLTRAREICARLVQGYGFQRQIVALQDELAKHQMGAAILGSEVEHDRNNHLEVGWRRTTQTELDKFGHPIGITIGEGERKSKDTATEAAEKIRSAYKVQVFDIEQKQQFEDANLAIELHLRELARQLFILDRAFVVSSVTYRPIDYETGAWVKQGTVVLRTRQLRSQR